MRSIVVAVFRCVCFLCFFSSRRRHTRLQGDWSSDVCSSDLFRKSRCRFPGMPHRRRSPPLRSEEHTSELQSPCNLVCRLLLEKKKKNNERTKSPKFTARTILADSQSPAHTPNCDSIRTYTISGLVFVFFFFFFFFFFKIPAPPPFSPLPPPPPLPR